MATLMLNSGLRHMVQSGGYSAFDFRGINAVPRDICKIDLYKLAKALCTKEHTGEQVQKRGKWEMALDSYTFTRDSYLKLWFFIHSSVGNTNVTLECKRDEVLISKVELVSRVETFLKKHKIKLAYSNIESNKYCYLMSSVFKTSAGCRDFIDLVYAEHV